MNRYIYQKPPRSLITLLVAAGAIAGALPSHGQTPGWEVRALDIAAGNGFEAIDNLVEAESFLNGTATTFTLIQDDRTVVMDVIDIAGGGGTFPVNHPYPNGTAGDGQDDVTVMATAEVTIPAGTWTIAMASDDGGQITVEGVDFSTGNAGAESRFGEDATPVRPTNDAVRFEGTRGHTWTGGTFVLEAPLTTTVTATMFERGGGDSFELAVRDASTDIVNTVTAEEGSGWQLLGNEVLGWTVMNTASPAVFIGGPDTTGSQILPSQLENEVFETGEVTPGLTQEWWGIASPGNKGAFDAAFSSRLPDVGPFKADLVWWTGSGAAIEGFPTYPEGISYVDNYIVRLTGEIFIPESGTYQFKDGVDDFIYVAIDADKSGSAGDVAEEIIINDNTWTGVLGNDNGGSPISPATFEVAEGGEWLAIEINIGEGGGGDAGILYWDYSVDGGLGAGVGFPAAQTDAIDAANAGALLIPETHLRSALQTRIRTDIVSRLPNIPIEDGPPLQFEISVNDTPSNTWTVAGGTGIVASLLNTPPVVVTADGEVVLTLNHRYFLEDDGTVRWDGGQVRLSVNGGEYTTVPDTAFTQNGYPTDRPITGNNILNGQFAFNGKSEGYDDGTTVESIATLGTFVAGDQISVQFAGAWDEGYYEPTTNWEIAGVAMTNVDTTPELADLGVSNLGVVEGPWTFNGRLASDWVVPQNNPDPTVFSSFLDLNDAALEVHVLSGTPQPGDRFQLLGSTGSLFLLDFGASGDVANGVAPGWDGIDNLVMDVPHVITDARGHASQVTITALDDGFNPNNTAAPGAGASFDGIDIPIEANDDYLFKIDDTAGTEARMEIANLNPGVYSVTLFEGRTTDTNQVGKIWSSGQDEPETENTGSFANGGTTVTVTIGEGESLFYKHLEDNSGGISGMIIREIPFEIVGAYRSLELPEGEWNVEGLQSGGDGSIMMLESGDTGAPVWVVRALDLNGTGGFEAIDNLLEAESFLNDTAAANIQVQDDRTVIREVIDIAGGPGSYTVDDPYPSGFSGDGQDDITVRATTEVTIPAGTWTIAFASDDGGGIQVEGVDFSTGNAGEESRFGEDATPVRNSNDSVRFEGTRGHTWTGGTFVLEEPLTTTITATMFERGGGDSFEIALRDASEGIDNAGVGEGWELLTEGTHGWTLTQPEASPAIHIGGMNRIDDQFTPYAVEDAVIEEGEQSEGLVHEWWGIASPGNKAAMDNAFASRLPDFSAFKTERTWWTGSGTAIEGVPAYPEGIPYVDSYIVRLTGEIFIPESGLYQFKDGVDDFIYVAIDSDGSGVAGDVAEEILLNDNNWTGVLGNDNGGSPIVGATFEVAEGGEWLPIVINIGEGGGGDAGILYWDYDVNGGGIGAGVGFPAVLTDAIDVANAGALLIPESHLRSTLTTTTSADLVVNLDSSLPMIFEVDAEAGTSDRVLINNPDAERYSEIVDVTDAQIVVTANGTLAEGTVLDLFGGATIRGTYATITLPEGDWDLSGLAPGGNGEIVLGEIVVEPTDDTFQVVSVTYTRGETEDSLSLTWASEVGHTYSIETSEDGETWTDLELSITGEEGTTSHTVEGVDPESSIGLYRVLDLGAAG